MIYSSRGETGRQNEFWLYNKILSFSGIHYHSFHVAIDTDVPYQGCFLFMYNRIFTGLESIFCGLKEKAVMHSEKCALNKWCLMCLRTAQMCVQSSFPFQHWQMLNLQSSSTYRQLTVGTCLHSPLIHQHILEEKRDAPSPEKNLEFFQVGLMEIQLTYLSCINTSIKKTSKKTELS